MRTSSSNSIILRLFHRAIINGFSSSINSTLCIFCRTLLAEASLCESVCLFQGIQNDYWKAKISLYETLAGFLIGLVIFVTWYDRCYILTLFTFWGNFLHAQMWWGRKYVNFYLVGYIYENIWSHKKKFPKVWQKVCDVSVRWCWSVRWKHAFQLTHIPRLDTQGTHSNCTIRF